VRVEGGRGGTCTGLLGVGSRGVRAAVERVRDDEHQARVARDVRREVGGVKRVVERRDEDGLVLRDARPLDGREEGVLFHLRPPSPMRQ
jgi:hypothetical protein